MVWYIYVILYYSTVTNFFQSFFNLKQGLKMENNNVYFNFLIHHLSYFTKLKQIRTVAKRCYDYNVFFYYEVNKSNCYF